MDIKGITMVGKRRKKEAGGREGRRQGNEGENCEEVKREGGR